MPFNTAQHLIVTSARIRELGYQEQVSQEEAFERTVAWERSHPPEVSTVQFDYEAENDAVHKLKSSA